MFLYPAFPNFQLDAFTMITIAGLMGIAGAKLYHLLESPAGVLREPVWSFFHADWICVVRRIFGRIWHDAISRNRVRGCRYANF